MDYVALPKIELHAHLTGSVSRDTLHQIWLRKHAAGETDLEDPLKVMPEGKHDYNLETFFPLFGSYIYALLTDEASIRHAATSVLEHFLADGVVYLELRTTPRAAGSLSAEAHVRLLLDVIAGFEAAHGDAMHTRLILSIDRRHALDTAESIAALAARLRAEGGVGGGRVVGLDLCGDPTARPAGAVGLFTPVFERASSQGLGVTVHFAEAEASASPEELRILLAWRPARLGHVIWEDDESRREIARRGLCLELCLSCNVKAGMIRGGFESHHLKHWMGVDGPKISLGTDDVGVFGSPLSNEYRLVAQHFNLDRPRICALARQGIDAIFGGDKEKQRLRDIMWT
ncbi:adenosine/AMP deaminase domain-containing protein [Hirsutella rhossiliensis]|uniref:Adenosine/AMP deaminase domain-containing protein n=1 Tax=Hirsutella rhossiliensis TaxID=111463 RepID=A0A9P8MQW9_9HYPO|nr:adenosine/AMP deaminase domain-containing protein [Hirsutella rhossiliensis]KAH0960143.1 adenosine/AMP deaminase domain-containing protein [Hirsutella rhossiliensis]